MDRMAVSGTADAGSIPAWSANVIWLLQRTDSNLPKANEIRLTTIEMLKHEMHRKVSPLRCIVFVKGNYCICSENEYISGQIIKGRGSMETNNYEIKEFYGESVVDYKKLCSIMYKTKCSDMENEKEFLFFREMNKQIQPNPMVKRILMNTLTDDKYGKKTYAEIFGFK